MVLPDENRNREFLWILIAILVAICLRLFQLQSVSFWYDEACAWRISQFPWPRMLQSISRDAHPPFFYVLQKVWQSCWGTSVLSARLLSVFCGAGSLLAALFLMKTIFTTKEEAAAADIDPAGNSTRGIGAGDCTFCESASRDHDARTLGMALLLLAFNPFQVELCQQARPYALGVMLSLLALASLLRAWQTPHRMSHWLAFGLAGGLLSFTHYFGLLTLAGLFLAAGMELVCDRRGLLFHRQNLQRMAGLACCAGVLQCCWWPWLPVLENQYSRTIPQLWIPPLTGKEWFKLCAQTFAGTAIHVPGAGGMMLLIWICLPMYLFVRAGRAGRMLACASVVPLVASVSYSLFIRNILEPRYLAFSQVFLLMGMALAWGEMRSRVWQRITAVVLIGGLGSGCLEHVQARRWHAQHAGLRRTVEFLQDHHQADEPIVVCSPFLFVSLACILPKPIPLFVQYQQDQAADVLTGPALMHQDFESFAAVISQRPSVLWTIDADQLFGRSVNVTVPLDYHPVRQIRFAESFGIPMEVVVRSYRLDSPSGTKAGISSMKKEP